MLGSVLGFQEQTEAERVLMALLYDENEHLLSSLQLNQLATFTYHDQSLTGGRMIHERMLDILEQVISRPLDVSVLCMHKALVVLRHLLLVGAEKVLQPARTLGKYVYDIEHNYNTALMAQKNAVTGFLTNLKGGAVDKGGPARLVAQKINTLLSSPQTLQIERQVHASSDSLVPVGSHQRIAFITDEARLAILKQRLERERRVVVKSNLAKSDSAFGSGYNSKDGKGVVGAAHSLEEMIKTAEKKEQEKQRRFTDVPKPKSQSNNYNQQRSTFRDYQAPGSVSTATAATGDLLSMDAPAVVSPPAAAATADLLDFGAAATTSGPPVSADLLGSDFAAPPAAAAGGGHDIFSAAPPPPTSGGMALPSSDGMGAATSLQQQNEMLQQQNELLQRQILQQQNEMLKRQNEMLMASMTGGGPPPSAELAMGNGLMSASSADTATKKPMGNGLTTIAAPNEDRFAALDALATTSSTSKPIASLAPGGLDSLGPDLSSSLPPANGLAAPASASGMLDLASLVPSHPAPAAQAPILAPSSSSLRVGSVAVSTNHDDDDDGGGFVMGGAVGSGLEPVGAAPAAPPPPPPPA